MSLAFFHYYKANKMESTFTVKLNKDQIGELCHKLSIALDEPDILDSYDTTAEIIGPVYDYLLPINSDASVTLPKDLAPLFLGELRNCIDIANHNIQYSKGKEQAEYIKYRKDIYNAINAISKATGI